MKAASESTFKKSNTCGVSNNRLLFTLPVRCEMVKCWKRRNLLSSTCLEVLIHCGHFDRDLRPAATDQHHRYVMWRYCMSNMMNWRFQTTHNNALRIDYIIMLTTNMVIIIIIIKQSFITSSNKYISRKRVQ